MDICIRRDKKYSVTFLFLASLFILFSVVSAILGRMGIIIIPLITPPLVAIMLYDRSKNHILSACLCVASVLLDFLFNLARSFNCLASVLLALFIGLSMKKRYDKSFSAAISTVFLSIIVVCYAFISAFEAIGAFDISEAVDYLTKSFDSVRESLFVSIKDLYANTSFGVENAVVSDEIIRELIDLYFNLLICGVLIFSFALVGFTHKLLSLTVRLTAEEDDNYKNWRFITSSVFAYFYIALWFFQIFVSTQSIIGVSILNLYGIFLVVYAYLGFGIARYFFAMRLGKPLLATIIVLLLIMLFSGAAVQILSALGAFSTITYNRARSGKIGDGENKNGG